MTPLVAFALVAIWVLWLYLVIDTLRKGPRDRGSAFLIAGWTTAVILASMMLVVT